MEAAAHSQHDHHELPTSGGALNAVAFSATLHCLTGCAIGEVLGMIIGTALGFSDWGTIALAVALAFLFGYSLTSLPLLRAGLALSAVVPIALATDTFSIAVMEIVDNALMLAIPGAMEAGVGDVLFWGALSVALVVAGVVAFPVNRWLITRGRGHAVLHESGHHPNFPTRLVAIVATAAAIFGTTVLIAEAVSSDGDGMGHDGTPAAQPDRDHAADEQGPRSQADPVRGLAASADGLTLELATTDLSPGEPGQLRFQVVGEGGRAVRDFQVEHEKRLHLIVVRDDLREFQHLHPRMSADGSWATPITLQEPGSYRVFADFKHDGQNQTLARSVTVEGAAERLPLPARAGQATTSDGYTVHLTESSSAGGPLLLSFHVAREGQTVELQDYLGAKGHLVALREGDLAYLHTHPAGSEGHGGAHGGHGGAHAGHGGAHAGHGGPSGAVPFETALPSEGRYRLFFQFKHDGRVHTAAFTYRFAGGQTLP
ncbi:MAG TPA: DUF4396 domain-containing protein [Thermoleophilaceae bacterium]|nr:DUF4396 domain-containing protein [Thermoleophilaceae bacterium]